MSRPAHAVGGAIAHPWPDPPGPGAAIEVAEGVMWVRLPLPMALDHVNLYALDEGSGWTLVDTGLAWAKGRAALEAALAGPLGGRPVLRVILTHAHPDHIGLVGHFVRLGADLVTTRLAYALGRMLILDRQERPTPEQIAFRRRAGVVGAELDAYAATRPFNFADVAEPIPLGFRALAEGDRLRAGGRDWTARIGEGHAPAHLTLWSDDGLLLAGDQVLPGITPNIGVYATEPEADPMAAWLETCRRFRALGTDPLVLPGHKLPFRGLDQRLAELIEAPEAAARRLLAALAVEPRSARGLFAALYRRPIGAAEEGLALVEAVAHLNHLHARGAVRREDGPEGQWLWRPA